MVSQNHIIPTKQSWDVAPWLVTVLVAITGLPVFAGSIRTYDKAVVTTGIVRLSDIASLADFPISQGRRLAEIVIANAPQPGASSFISLQTIRDTMRKQGVNFAEITMHGATRCHVSRMMITSTAQASAMPESYDARSSHQALIREHENRPYQSSGEYRSSRHNTLRQAVVNFFRKELDRYRGVVDVTFDRHNEQMLGLSGPNYTFRITRSSKAKLGLTSVRVDVLSASTLVQTIPLAVNVSLTRSLLSAKRAINAKATIRDVDVEIVPIVVTALEQAVVDSANLAVGLRAKRFIAQGTLIKPEMLESIPVVMRGQLVRFTSVSGGVSVVTAAKASENGYIGETITVRSVNNKRVEFPATVVGPGSVQIGGHLPEIMGITDASGKRP